MEMEFEVMNEPKPDRKLNASKYKKIKEAICNLQEGQWLKVPSDGMSDKTMRSFHSTIYHYCHRMRKPVSIFTHNGFEVITLKEIF